MDAGFGNRETTRLSRRIVIDLPLNIDPDTTAVVFDPVTGEEYDEVGGWETAIQYAHDGYLVIVMNPAGFPYDTVEKLQAAVDYEHELVADCFGRETPELVES